MQKNKLSINYKIVSIALTGVLLVTYAWHWEDIFFHNKMNDGMKMGNMQMKNHNMNMSGDMMDMTMSDMVKMMEGKTGKALEKEFITGMIPHHKGAVEMAKKLLEDKTISSEIKAFAENIIKAQDAEIIQMGEWLKRY